MGDGELIGYLKETVIPHLQFAIESQEGGLYDKDGHQLYLLAGENLRVFDETKELLRAYGVGFESIPAPPTTRRMRFDVLRRAMQDFLDSIPNDDLPLVVHGIIGFKDPDTEGLTRYYPIRMVRRTTIPADGGGDDEAGSQE